MSLGRSMQQQCSKENVFPTRSLKSLTVQLKKTENSVAKSDKIKCENCVKLLQTGLSTKLCLCKGKR